MQCTLYAGNSNLMELKGLQNGATASYENAAAVSVTLRDEHGVQIVGQTWPKAMAYVTGSDGDYRGTLEEGLSLVHGQFVTAEILATASGLTGKWETRCKVIERT